MLDKQEEKLVIEVQKLAGEIIEKTNYSGRHSVAAGILAESGKKYFGINVDSIHGTCAEIVAYVNAVMNGELIIKTVVAVSSREKGIKGIISPCGNCRQILVENNPNVQVILNIDGQLVKKSVYELIPFAYDNSYKKGK